MVTLEAEDNEGAAREIEERHNLSPKIENDTVTFTVPHGEELLPEFVRGLKSRLLSVSVRRPTLDDVFLSLTGHAIREQQVNAQEQMKGLIRQRGR